MGKSIIPYSFIQNELNRCGLPVKETTGDWMIPCPFHQETHPSLGISKGGNIPIGSFHCFSGDTLVHTYYGTRKISSIIGKKVKVVDGNGDFVDTVFKSYGVDRLYKITLRRNMQNKTIYATSGHRWFVYGRKNVVVTKDLKSGTYLDSVLPKPYPNLKPSIEGIRRGNKLKNQLRWKIISVEETDRIEEVYCCNISTTHSFMLTDNILTGNCFGCNTSGSWNKLASHMNLRLWDAENEESSFWVIPAKKTLQKQLSLGDSTLSKWDGTYKNYPPSFLEKFGAKKLFIPNYKADYLYLPVKYYGEISGYCRARLREQDPGPKYWFPLSAKKVLYPLDYMLGLPTNCITLVEGVGDAFRLLYNGIPALAILGSAITDDMLDQLSVLCIENIIVCLDGDEPGKKATFGYKLKGGKRHIGVVEKLAPYYDVRVLRPPLEHDPDDMPQLYINVLKKMNLNLGGCDFTI